MNFVALLAVTFVVVLLVIAAMAIGVLFGRDALRGSCGGVGPNGTCPRCTGTCPSRSRQN